MDSVPLAGYDSVTNGAVDQYFRADLVIDKHRLPTYFVVCNTGRHDLIVGRKLLEDAGVWINCGKRALQWPSTDLRIDCKKDIRMPRHATTLRIDSNHQADADQRDARMNVSILKRGEVEALRTKNLISVPTTGSWTTDHQRDVRQMERHLSDLGPEDDAPAPVSEKPRKPTDPKKFAAAGLDVATIAAPAFLLNARKKGTIIGHTSVYEIQKLMEDRLEVASVGDAEASDPEEELQRQIDDKLPHPGYAGATLAHFSKMDSDVLPPHRPGVDHDIKLTEGNNLTSSPLYGMSLEQLKLVKDYLDDHLRRGFITHSDASYASPVLFAKKPGGGWRFCVDYRKLNAITKKDAYPIPLIQETLTRLVRASVFTKLDIRQAFYRIRLSEDVEDLTTFRTRYGNYKYRVLPFGLCNGPATFQRYINKVLHGLLDDTCTAYLDDILIYSESPLEHEEHVAQVLRRLKEAGLQADIRKSEFAVKSTKFLGFIISTGGVSKDPEKVAAVRDWPEPRSLKGLQSFLGFCNFYRAFLKDYGRVVRPLTKLLKRGAWHAFGEAEQAAFQAAKDLLLSDNVLAHYSPDRETRMETDASDGVVAGVLNQLQDNGTWHPVAFYSKTMNLAQMNYDIHDKEMLAVVKGLEEWRHQLVGLQTPGPFHAVTDHRALEFFMTKRELTPRQMRWSHLVTDSRAKLTYRPGTANVVADALSRKQEELKTQKEKDKAARTTTFLSPEQVEINVARADTNDDEPHAGTHNAPDPGTVMANTPPVTEDSDPSDPSATIDRILELNCGHESLQTLREQAEPGNRAYTLEKGHLLFKGRLYVPEAEFARTRLIRAVHATRVTAHPGKRKTGKLLREKYFWPGMQPDIDTYVAACKACRRSHTPRDKTPGLLKSLPIPDRAWQDLSVDFKSFPKDRKGYDNVMVVVDRLSKRVFSLPCQKTVTAPEAADLYYRYIWRVYGSPRSLVSDRGPQFISAFTDELCRLNGVKQKLSTTYHPQTDGSTEIMNQYLDQRLRPFVNYHQDNWSDLLPCMDWAQATLPHETTGLSPYEIEFGHRAPQHWDWEARTHVDAGTPRERMTRDEARAYVKVRHEAVQLATNIARESMAKAQQRQATQANKKRREPDFGIGDYVYLTPKGFTTGRPSAKLDLQMHGPYLITGMRGYSYRVALPPNMQMSDVFHADRLRKASPPLPGQVEPEEPPIVVNGEPEWEVDEILDSRVSRSRLQYRASWVGHDPDPTWYNARGFMSAPQKVRDFHLAYPRKAGPPQRLDTWLRAWEEDEDLEPTAADDKPKKSTK